MRVGGVRVPPVPRRLAVPGHGRVVIGRGAGSRHVQGGRDRGPGEQRGGRDADEGGPAVAGPARGDGVPQSIQRVRGGLQALDGPAQEDAQLLFPARSTRRCVVVHHDCAASIATRSAAMPRDPYAFTEPSDIPSVSATWASVMSAK